MNFKKTVLASALVLAGFGATAKAEVTSTVKMYGSMTSIMGYGGYFDTYGSAALGSTPDRSGHSAIIGDHTFGITYSAMVNDAFSFGAKLSADVGGGSSSATVKTGSAYIYAESKYFGMFRYGIHDSALDSVNITNYLGLGYDVYGYGLLQRGSKETGKLNNGTTGIETDSYGFKRSELDIDGPTITYFTPKLWGFQGGFSYGSRDSVCFGAEDQYDGSDVLGTPTDMELGCHSFETSLTHNVTYSVAENVKIRSKILLGYKFTGSSDTIGEDGISTDSASVEYAANMKNGFTAHKLNAGFDTSIIINDKHDINLTAGMIYNWLPEGDNGLKIGKYKDKTTSTNLYIDDEAYTSVVDAAINYTYNEKYYAGLWVGYNDYDQFSNLLAEFSAGMNIVGGMSITGSIFYGAVLDENGDAFREKDVTGYSEGMGFAITTTVDF